MRVAVIDYGSGNLHSAQKALEKAANKRSDVHIEVTSDPEAVRKADRVVLPGVGAFGDCKRGLDHVSGLVQALEESVLSKGRPFLGICVGMQLLATRGLEHEDTPGLGWIRGLVTPLAPNEPSLRVPQMGWNTLIARKSHPLLEGIPLGNDGLHAYFVHSFFFKTERMDDVVADTDYGGAVTAVVARDNIAGTQFHPEKSQTLGIAFLDNFLRWKP